LPGMGARDRHEVLKSRLQIEHMSKFCHI
jgi:hypothetical protein